MLMTRVAEGWVAEPSLNQVATPTKATVSQCSYPDREYGVAGLKEKNEVLVEDETQFLFLCQTDNAAVKILGGLAAVKNIMRNNLSVIFTLESEFMIVY